MGNVSRSESGELRIDGFYRSDSIKSKDLAQVTRGLFFEFWWEEESDIGIVKGYVKIGE
jgi:hypothetical protein